jgi:hypothetical protein
VDAHRQRTSRGPSEPRNRRRIESHIAEAIEQGRDPAEARRAFGGALRTREECRDFRVLAWLDSLRADTVFAWRQFSSTR